MALQDPEAPVLTDPAVAEAMASQRDPFLDWYYNQQQAAPANPYAPLDPLAVNTADYSLTSPPPPPPTTAPPAKQIGGMGGVMETAAAPAIANPADGIDPNLIELEPNAPAAAPGAPTLNIGQPRAPSAENLYGENPDPTAPPVLPVVPEPLQPGLGIPQPTLDQLALPQSSAAPSAGEWAPADWSPTKLLDASKSRMTSPGSPDELANAAPRATEDELAKAEWQKVQKMDPKQFALYMAEHQDALDKHMAARIHDEATKDLQRAEQNHERLLEAHAKAEADTQQLQRDAIANANTKIIRDRRSPGTKLAGVLMAVIGGFIQGRQGGPNMGLQLVMKSLEEDVQDQKDEIANRQHVLGMRRGFIADEYARSGDLHKAEETYRLSMLEGVKQDLQAEAQKFDPAGSQAIKRRMLIEQIDGAQRQSIEAYNKARLEEALKLSDLEGKTLDNAKKRGALVGGVATKIPRQQIISDLGFDPGRDLSDKELDKLLERKGKISALGADDRKVAEEQRKEVQQLGVAGLTSKDGKTPYKAPDVETARSLRQKLDAAQQITGILDRVLDLRDKVGGESDWANSDYRQEYEVLQNELTLLKKSGTQGMSSDEDMKKLEKSLGASNVAGFRAQSAGLEVARDRTVQAARSAFKFQGNYEGPIDKGPLAFPKAYVPAVETSADQNKKHIDRLQMIIDNKNSSKELKDWAEQQLLNMRGSQPTSDVNDELPRAAGAKEQLPVDPATEWGAYLPKKGK